MANQNGGLLLQPPHRLELQNARIVFNGQSMPCGDHADVKTLDLSRCAIINSSYHRHAHGGVRRV